MASLPHPRASRRLPAPCSLRALALAAAALSFAPLLAAQTAPDPAAPTAPSATAPATPPASTSPDVPAAPQQQAPTQAQPTGTQPAASAATGQKYEQTLHLPADATRGIVLDRVVAIVNGEVVLESDVEQERRFSAFQPITDPTGSFSRKQAIERLINRHLLLQQAKQQPQQPITEADITKQIEELRRVVPACKAYHCETDRGWNRYLAAQGVDINELRTHWRDRMEALQFIEFRFRMGIRIPQAEIKAYYEKTMLPEYARQKVVAPKLEVVSDRIQEVLLEQQVSGLLADWLKSLRAQGTVQIVADGGSPA